MVYLVSTQTELFKSTKYEKISVEDSLKLLDPLKIVQLDTETEGLDVFTNKLLTVQLGNKDIQIVIDCTTINILLYKEYLESDRLFLLWNALFDLKFLYHQKIYVNKIYDGMLAEKLIYLGYPAGKISVSLRATAERYLGIDIDKTIRGKINQIGLTEDVVLYAAGDVERLEDIKNAQDITLTKENLHKAVAFENEFVKCLAYIEYCGVKIDVPRWKAKMAKDKERLMLAVEALNNWTIQYYENNKDINNPGYNIFKWVDDNESIPKNAKFIRSEEAYNLYSIPCKFVDQNMQGDLFSGFEEKPHCTINWSSSMQVIPLFELLGFNLNTFDKASKKKKKSVEAKIIKAQKHVSPIAGLFLEYQKAVKVVSTYGQNWLDAINPVTGRIHASFHQLGADTGRLSCGGGLANVNFQNLPKNEETRACFNVDQYNKWISADYSGQETAIIASVSNDKAMIETLTTGCRDIHSLVAKMSFPKIVGNTPIEEIKHKFPKVRDDAKGVEFSIYYGGDDNTIFNTMGIPKIEAKEIYNNFMAGFPGVATYQNYCRKEVMNRGYILLNPITNHKAHIWDFDEIKRIENKFSEEGFWEYYRMLKREDSSSETVRDVKHYFKRKSDIEKQSINYRIQHRGAMAFKLASIKLFNYLKQNNLLNVVKYTVPVHDEINLECPEALSDRISKVLVQCMVDGGKPFCPRVYLGADVNIDDYWVH